MTTKQQKINGLESENKNLKIKNDNYFNDLEKEIKLNCKQSSEIHRLRVEREKLLFRKKELHDLKNKLISEYFENTKTQRIEKTLQQEIIGILIDVAPDLIRTFLKPEKTPHAEPTKPFRGFSNIMILIKKNTDVKTIKETYIN